MTWAIVYGGLAAIVGALCWSTRSSALRALSGLLFLAWVLENVWTLRLGWEGAPPAIALSDVVLAYFTVRVALYVGAPAASRVIIGLFAARFAVQLIAAAWPPPHYGYVFYAILNLLYALQLGSLGVGALSALATRRTASRRRDFGGWVRAHFRLGS